MLIEKLNNYEEYFSYRDHRNFLRDLSEHSDYSISKSCYIQIKLYDLLLQEFEKENPEADVKYNRKDRDIGE